MHWMSGCMHECDGYGDVHQCSDDVMMTSFSVAYHYCSLEDNQLRQVAAERNVDTLICTHH